MNDDRFLFSFTIEKALVIIASIALVSLLLAMLFCCELTDQCYINSQRRSVGGFFQTTEEVYKVYRTVEWGLDLSLGSASSYDGVATIIEANKCKLPMTLDESVQEQQDH